MTTPSQFELIAFDLGNVLCSVDEQSVSEQLALLSGKTPQQVHQTVFAQTLKLEFERGIISFQQHAERAIQSLEVDISLDEFTDIYDSVLIPTESMFPLVDRIAKTHRIALVSNTSEPHWHAAERFLPFSSKLNPVVVSYAVGAMKPEHAFYESLLERCGIPASKILFVDDLSVNIEGAEANGITGHQFTSQRELETALVRMNVI